MIKAVIKVVFYFVLFLYALLFFLPKTELYYFGLNNLASYKVQVSDETITNKPFGIWIKNPLISYSSIDTAQISSIDLNVLLVSNKLSISNIKIIGAFEKFVPKQINSIFIEHNILNPLKIMIDIDVDDCVGYGEFDLVTQTLQIKFKPSVEFKNKYKMVFSQMKKIGQKEYLYEYSL